MKLTLVLTGLTATSLLLTGTPAASAAPTRQPADCMPLHVLVANGTTESSSDANPDVDTGFGAQIVLAAGAALNETKPVLSRAYVPYAASFGGKPFDRSKDTYDQSVTGGVAATRTMLTDQAARCPNQRMMLIGHSQGAQVMSQIAREIGAGTGPIAGDRLAGVALFGDPTRPQGAPVFASAQQSAPQPVPGARSKQVSQVRLGAAAPPPGGGIAPNPTRTTFGSVAGRVGNFCVAGDLSCDTPPDAALAHVVANVAGQSKLDPSDPIGILTSVGTAVGQSLLYTGAAFVNDHISYSNGRIQVRPTGPSVLDRLVESTNPHSRPEDALNQAIKAVTKIAGMGIGAAITIAKDLLNPATIVQIVAAGVANPAAALGILGTKLADAALKLIPPVTIDNAVKLIFNEIEQGIVDNAGLVQIAMDTRYWNTAQQHTSGYANTPVGAQGQSAVRYVIDWIIAAAADIADTPAPTRSTRPTGPGPLLAPPSQPVVSASSILSGATRPGK
ncbi:cutinase family protein [Nocardia asiatica]|uniref:cutinase family protein n=1 Tax=Nocardia asiatica TaxID=209252 RepID=UPI0003043BE2|nr:cutinase family protein [Nocardia asiatica]